MRRNTSPTIQGGTDEDAEVSMAMKEPMHVLPRRWRMKSASETGQEMLLCPKRSVTLMFALHAIYRRVVAFRVGWGAVAMRMRMWK